MAWQPENDANSGPRGSTTISFSMAATKNIVKMFVTRKENKSPNWMNFCPGKRTQIWVTRMATAQRMKNWLDVALTINASTYLELPPRWLHSCRKRRQFQFGNWVNMLEWDINGQVDSKGSYSCINRSIDNLTRNGSTYFIGWIDYNMH